MGDLPFSSQPRTFSRSELARDQLRNTVDDLYTEMAALRELVRELDLQLDRALPRQPKVK